MSKSIADAIDAVIYKMAEDDIGALPVLHVTHQQYDMLCHDPKARPHLTVLSGQLRYKGIPVEVHSPIITPPTELRARHLSDPS